jgi:hypothetical protein
MHKFKVGDFIRDCDYTEYILLIKDLDCVGNYVTIVIAPGFYDEHFVFVRKTQEYGYELVIEEDIIHLLSDDLKTHLVQNYSEEV